MPPYQETDFAAHDFCAARQDRLAEEMHSELSGVLRGAYAAALGTAPERVALGSEGHPALGLGLGLGMWYYLSFFL